MCLKLCGFSTDESVEVTIIFGLRSANYTSSFTSYDFRAPASLLNFCTYGFDVLDRNMQFPSFGFRIALASVQIRFYNIRIQTLFQMWLVQVFSVYL